MNKETSKVYYKDADFLVTSSKARAQRKTYRVDKIEKISLRRDPFLISLAMTVFTILFFISFGRESTFLPTIVLSIMVSATIFLRRIGMLYITSKAISELAFIGLYERLEQVREAIEKSMHKEDESGMSVADEDDDED